MIKRFVTRLTLKLLLLCLSVGLSPAASQQLASPRAEPFSLSATRESDGALRLDWRIASGHYLYRDKIGATTDAGPLEISTPKGEIKDDPTFGVTEIYKGRATAIVRGATAGEAVVTYQGCQEAGVCFPPERKRIDLATLAVSQMSQGFSLPAAPSSGPPIRLEPASTNSGLFASVQTDGGRWAVLATFALLGLGLAFTPCVFPMYPILAGALARADERLSTGRALALSLAYVVSMALAFGLIGLAAGWSGENLQMALQAPAAVAIAAVVFVALALSMFGLYELQLPARWVNALGGRSFGARGSLQSTAALGFTSALIVGPCVTAPLAGALLYIAQTGDTAFGAAALFAMGLGKGVPLVVFGTAGARVLPRAGAWMETVKHLFGFVFLGMAVWMASRFVSPPTALAAWALLFMAAGAFLGAFDHLDAATGPARRLAKAAGVAASVYGVLLGVGAASGADDPLRPLAQIRNGSGSQPQLAFAAAEDSSALARALAPADGRSSLVYFTADWCTTCAAIERSTLSQADVRARLESLNLVKVDVTANTAEQRALMRDLRVMGPPTMLFVDATGKEAQGTRLVGDIAPSALLAAIDQTAR